MPGYLEETPEGVVLRLQVLPRSSKNQIVGPHGDALKVKLTSPPVDGAANKCCCDFLAKLLGVPKSNVAIVGGETSRRKRVLIRGLTKEGIAALL
jgi:uncharacterized protein (TIGR00251 family)